MAVVAAAARAAVSPDVIISGGQFLMRSAARIATSTTGANGANGDVRIDATDMRLAGGSQIRTGTTARIAAGASR